MMRLRVSKWDCLGSDLQGRVVVSLRPNSSSPGLAVWLSIGVARRCNRAVLMSFPDSIHFFIVFLMVPTVLSAIPFDWGYRGLEVVWAICQSNVNFLNGAPINCGPLSEIIVSGRPIIPQIVLKCSAISSDLVVFKPITMGNFEK